MDRISERVWSLGFELLKNLQSVITARKPWSLLYIQLMYYYQYYYYFYYEFDHYDYYYYHYHYYYSYYDYFTITTTITISITITMLSSLWYQNSTALCQSFLGRPTLASASHQQGGRAYAGAEDSPRFGAWDLRTFFGVPIKRIIVFGAILGSPSLGTLPCGDRTACVSPKCWLQSYKDLL